MSCSKITCSLDESESIRGDPVAENTLHQASFNLSLLHAYITDKPYTSHLMTMSYLSNEELYLWHAACQRNDKDSYKPHEHLHPRLCRLSLALHTMEERSMISFSAFRVLAV